MSFESDLRAWLERVLALSGIQKLSPDDRRRMIQRLLVGAVLPQLGPIRRGIADDPEIREAARPGFPIEEDGFILERGLLIVTPPSFGVYVGTALDAEWLAAPPSYFWGNLEHPQGILSTGGGVCRAGKDAPNWTGAESLGLQKDYTSRATSDQINAWRSEIVRESALYNGLLRLVAEGWGPHENFTKLQPGTWPDWRTAIDAGYRGIIRFRDDGASTYRYFLIYLGPTIGCRAVELSIDASVACLVDELYHGPLTTSEWLVTEEQVLRKLYLDTGAQDFELISQQDYDQTIIGFTLEHGWKFAPHRKGSPLENVAEANIVTLEFEESGNEAWYNTRHCKVSFTFSGTLSAVLSLEEQGKVYFDSGDVHHPLWEDLDTQGLLVRMMPAEGPLFPDAPADLSAETPVYAFDYDNEGIDLLRYVKKEIIAEPGNPGYFGVKMTSCDGEVSQDQWYREASTIIKGGWKTNHIDFTQDLVIGQSTRWTRRFWHKPHGATQGTANRSEPFGCGCDGPTILPLPWRERYTTARGQSCDPSAVDDEIAAMRAGNYSNGSYGPIEAQGSQGSLERDEETFGSADYGGHGVIIPKMDACAVILMSGQSRLSRQIQSPGGTRTITRPVTDWMPDPCDTDDFPTDSRAPVGAWRFSLLRIVNQGDPLTCIESGWHSYLGDSCYCNDPNGGCSGGQSFEVVESFADPNSGQLKIVGQGIEIDGTDQYNDIKDYIEASVAFPDRPWRPIVKFQFGTNAIYQEKPESAGQGIISNAGFDQQALDDGNEYKFIGS